MESVSGQTAAALAALLNATGLRKGDILVVGCSTSEIIGERIGKSGSMDAANAVLGALLSGLEGRGVFLAIQCCEHLNRAVVVERECMQRWGLEQVLAVPHPRAGGSLATAAMAAFGDPVVVEGVKAHAGMDIGDTLIGMQLRHVAVPLRLPEYDKIGKAHVTFATTRPKYIGGPRAHYSMDSEAYSH